jgi:hypothetical protein
MSRAEWRWLGLVTLVTLLLVEIPYLLAYSQESNGWLFTGMLWSAFDFAQYAAAMREGAASASWLIHDHLTGEPHAAVFMYPLYVGLGKLAALIGLDFQIAYHLAEVVARATLLVAIYRFAAAVFPSVNRRRLAFVVVTFSSGLSVWLLLADAVVPFMGELHRLFTTELYLPDVSTFQTLFIAPHHMLGLALLLFALGTYLAAWSDAGRRAPAATGLATLGLGLANPFSLVTLVSVILAHLALMWLLRVGQLRRPLLALGLAWLAAAPFLVYSLLVFGADPFWGRVYVKQNVTPTLPFFSLVIGLAPVLVLTALGAPAMLWRPTPARWLVVVFIMLSLALMYAPLGLGFQRRFAFGLQPMLALVAAVGLEPFWQLTGRDRAAQKPRRSPLLAFGLLLALFASTTCIYAFKLQMATRPTGPMGQDGAFQPVSLREPAGWLKSTMEPHDVVLAEALTANYLAGLVPGRVFAGHPIATVDYWEKEHTMRQFYLGDGEARSRFLAANNIRYVVYGPHEHDKGALPPSDPRLEPVYATDEVLIYQVQTLTAGTGPTSIANDR